MKINLLQWLRPQDLATVASLQLFARDVVEGMRGGIHRSRHVGASVDFKEHRPYVSGDEIRSIDWKLFGKTDRLYIKQFEDETNLRCTLLLDSSGSMKYAGTRSNQVSKHEYSVRLAACLSYLLISQQDAIGVATFQEKITGYLPHKSHPNHLHSILELITSARTGSSCEISAVVQELLHRIKRGGMIVILSDGFGDPEQWSKSLALLRSNQQEVVFFQILDDDEIDFPFQQRTMFRSLEQSEDEKLIDPTSLRSQYLSQFEEHQNLLEMGCRKIGVDLITTKTSQPFSEAISKYLAFRRGIQ